MGKAAKDSNTNMEIDHRSNFFAIPTLICTSAPIVPPCHPMLIMAYRAYFKAKPKLRDVAYHAHAGGGGGGAGSLGGAGGGAGA